MLRHAELWRAIDRLAAAHGMSPSALAREAGLDPTTFNKSKRVAPDGKRRWPNSESIAKALKATHCSLADLVVFAGGAQAAALAQRVPVIGYAQAGEEGYFDDAGYPVGSGWDEVLYPNLDDPYAYALEIAGNSMEPLYRDGDVVIVSPEASIRRGDRIVLKTEAGEVMAKQLLRQSARKIEVLSINNLYPDRILRTSEVLWMSRILWVSQ